MIERHHRSSDVAVLLAGVGRTFETPAGEHEVLRGIDLRVGHGELVAITGRSGSGKSTLLQLMGGLDRPSSGSVVVGGRALCACSERELAAWRLETIGFVFQFFQLLPTLTVVENVMLPMDFHGVPPGPERRPRALELLERVDLGGHATRLPSALSGGEQQRVAVARALANSPEILLCDEPTGNLDASTAAGVLDLFFSLPPTGVTVVIATHDPRIARRADRTLALVDGRLEGSTAAVAACSGPR